MDNKLGFTTIVGVTEHILTELNHMDVILLSCSAVRINYCTYIAFETVAISLQTVKDYSTITRAFSF